MRNVTILTVVFCVVGCGQEPRVDQCRPTDNDKSHPGAIDQDETPKPLPPDIVTAWEKAGAIVGWMGPDSTGWRDFHAKGKPKPGELPTIRFPESIFKSGIIPPLLPPEQGFGMEFNNIKISDVDLKELRGLKNLRLLELSSTPVTDRGIKELAPLKSL